MLSPPGPFRFVLALALLLLPSRSESLPASISAPALVGPTSCVGFAAAAGAHAGSAPAPGAGELAIAQPHVKRAQALAPLPMTRAYAAVSSVTEQHAVLLLQRLERRAAEERVGALAFPRVASPAAAATTAAAAAAAAATVLLVGSGSRGGKHHRRGGGLALLVLLLPLVLLPPAAAQTGSDTQSATPSASPTGSSSNNCLRPALF